VATRLFDVLAELKQRPHQTFINKSDDFAEFRATRAEGLDSKFTGS